MRVLAGDIGGTNARLAIMEGDTVLFQRSYPSESFSEFDHILAEFKKESAIPLPGKGCLAVAGVVVSDTVKATNLPWSLDGTALKGIFGLEALYLINDFEAAAWGITKLTGEHLEQIGRGTPDPAGPKGVLGAGTGMGQAIIVPLDQGYKILPTEGGHADFAPRNAIEIRLLTHLMADMPHVSVERVLSGPGLTAIYRFLLAERGTEESPSLAAAVKRDDPAAVITRHALEAQDSLCAEALSMFCSIYGAEAGNLALKCLATGGIYVAGGIAPRILPCLRKGGFRDAFEAKGRMSEVLRRIPTYVVTHPCLGLLGAAVIARK
jgi:glucokinase